MKLRFATNDEIQGWNKLVIKNPDGGNVFQTYEFAMVKAANNWTPKFIVANNIYFMVLERKITFLGNLWYVPKGPGITYGEQLQKLLPALKDFAKQYGVFLFRLEPELLKSDKSVGKLSKYGVNIKKGVQVPNTIIIDVSGDIGQIEAGFSSKTRYNIRSARKANVSTKVVPINVENCNIFYDMMIETIHGRAHLRSREYYKLFWQSHDKAGTGKFVFAYVDGSVVSTNFITILGQKATRKDAASVRERVVRGASALLEIDTIAYLKTLDIKQYDLCGTPPSDQIKNPEHPFYGVGVFKSGFNENVTDYIGCLDLAIKPLAYKIWDKFGERLFLKLYYVKHHDLYF